MAVTSKYQQDWENLAQLNPEWAILTTDTQKKQSRWDSTEFFATGEKDIDKFLTYIKNLGIELNMGEALDFGCGIGRLTRALAAHFTKVYGVDISATMLATARKLHQDNPHIIFMQNTANDLSCFDSEKFDLICSLITLQHIPDKEIIKNFIHEFVRILKPGGILYFQLPSVPGFSPIKTTLLKIRGQIYYLLTNLGISKEFCYRRLKIMPLMHMNYMFRGEIEAILNGQAKLLQTYDDNTINQRYLIQKSNNSTNDSNIN
ncbi:MAG: class I SAM-dependent methyltransferase [Patescibacteria group bacterium]|jgi:ubiquinone/menaquinone biosynthesis C-methylase UbiE